MHRLLDRYFNFIKRFIPAQPDAASIGLDISENECKMVMVKQGAKAYQVTRWAIEPLSRDNPADAIKRVLSDLDLGHASIQTAVCGKGTLIRYIEMPRMTIDELRASFALESDKYFPFAQDQIYTDCYILDPQGKTKQMDVMAAASTKDLVDDRLKLINEAGVQSDFICINSVALANAIKMLGFGTDEDDKQEKESQAYALVDVGQSVSSVTIMVEAIPRFSRDIFIGGRDLTKRMANSLGLEMKDAEKLKNDPGKKAKEVASACESIYQNMTQEIRLSFDYFSTEKNKEVSRVLLTGDASSTPGIKEALSENLEVEVQLWNPFEKCEFGEAVVEEEVKKNANRLGIALGLALYNYD